MKRGPLIFVVFLAALSLLSGWLMSHMSWLGRIGITLFHRDFRFLKVWYKGAALIFFLLIILYGLQSLMKKKCSARQGKWLQVLAIIAALAGLWLTFRDFQTDFSHSILKERFHLGVYLFWVGWICISLRLLWPQGDAQGPDVPRTDRK
ncbi:MAG: hypothetical protein JST06_06630 [Bacteroidetes bacterium]|nr:hypothetical protein [Bacteroidota bacterium]MBS1629882.1 hypothetical protein [Bacteroidota bacterium]